MSEHTPEARLKRHTDYWGDSPAPGIAARLESIRQLIDAGMTLKAMLILEKLDHLRTEVEWNQDPDTILGNKQRNSLNDYRRPSVSAEQIQAIITDPKYPTRQAQAAKLGITVRQLQRRIK